MPSSSAQLPEVVDLAVERDGHAAVGVHMGWWLPSRSMMDRRRKPIATSSFTKKSPHHQGPRWIMRSAMSPDDGAVGPPSSKSAAVNPTNPAHAFETPSLTGSPTGVYALLIIRHRPALWALSTRNASASRLAACDCKGCAALSDLKGDFADRTPPHLSPAPRMWRACCNRWW